MGTYNYSARELADEIGKLLTNLEGDFTGDELNKALGLVRDEHGKKRKRGIKKRVLEICKHFDKRVKEAGVPTAGHELAVALAEAESNRQ